MIELKKYLIKYEGSHRIDEVLTQFEDCINMCLYIDKSEENKQLEEIKSITLIEHDGDGSIYQIEKIGNMYNLMKKILNYGFYDEENLTKYYEGICLEAYRNEREYVERLLKYFEKNK